MIVVAGEALIDLIVHPDGRLTAIPGGGPFNTARTIGRLGVDVAFLGRLSTDRFGRILSGALAADGVDLRWATLTEAPTTLAVAELDDVGAASYRFHFGRDLGARPDPRGRAGGPPRRAPRDPCRDPRARRRADGVGARRGGRSGRSLDARHGRPELPAAGHRRSRRLPRASPRRHVAGGHRQGQRRRSQLSRARCDALDAARALLSDGAGVVLLTDGARTVTILTESLALDVPVPKVDVVDTVGSGDAFGGGFLARWIERGWGRAELSDAETRCAKPRAARSRSPVPRVGGPAPIRRGDGARLATRVTGAAVARRVPCACRAPPAASFRSPSRFLLLAVGAGRRGLRRPASRPRASATAAPTSGGPGAPHARGYPIAADGVFGTATRSAVKALPGEQRSARERRSSRRDVDRLADHPSGRAHRRRPSASLQRQLNAKRTAGLTVDGIYGAHDPDRGHRLPDATVGINADARRRRPDLARLLWHYDCPSFNATSLCDYSVGNGPGELGHGRRDRPARGRGEGRSRRRATVACRSVT